MERSPSKAIQTSRNSRMKASARMSRRRAMVVPVRRAGLEVLAGWLSVSPTVGMMAEGRPAGREDAVLTADR